MSIFGKGNYTSNYTSNTNNTEQKKPAVVGRATIDFGFEHREVEVNFYKIENGMISIFTHDRETGRPQKIICSCNRVVLILNRREYESRYPEEII